MNPNEQPFFDLAMKVIAGQASPAEQTELTALTSRDAALKAELEQLRMDVALAREVMPLLAATEASDRKMPGYGRERLQTKVRQTLGAPKREAARSGMWRWWIGLATAAAAVVLVVVLNRPGPNLPPGIQVAMLDSVGTVRGTGEKPLELLQKQWKEAKPQEFDDAVKLKQWQEGWPTNSDQTVVKVIYDRDSLELRILLWRKGKTIERVLVAKDEKELSRLINEADRFIQEQAR